MTGSNLDAKLPAVDRTGRPGGILSFLLVAVAVLGVIGLLLLGRSETYVILVLGVLGTVGVFLLLMIALGLLRFSSEDASSPGLRAVVDSATDGIVMTDARGRVIYANPAYRDLVGSSENGVVRPIERVFVGDPDVSEAVYRLLKAAREGRRLQEEVRIAGVRPGDPARWLRLRVGPLDGAAARKTVWTIADVTRDRGRQENVFQELQQAIDYLDHAPAGFFSVDAAGNIVYLNATLANWLDYDLGQVGSGGLKLTDIIAGNGAALLTALGAVPGDVRSETIDLDLKTRDGRTLPVRLYHKVAFAADGTSGASRTLVLNRARDDHADPERAAEVRFMRFFHNTPMAIATVDKHGRIARVNALFARLFQSIQSAETAAPQSRSILSVVAERDRAALETAIAKAAGGQGDVAPVDAALAGDAERWAQFYVTPVEDAERDSEAAIVYTLDVTDRHALEEQRNRAQKLDQVGRFAGGIAHDFNNVLSAIMMAADFLLNAHKPTDPSFADIMQIRQNANRAAALVRQLLAFSRRQTMRPQVLDLSEALSDIEMLLRRTVGEKVKLEVVHARDLWPVKADLSQFEQVVMNLVVNARDAMPDGGKLTVATSNISKERSRTFPYPEMPAAEYVCVEVSDSGSGIPPEIADKIFEPFFTTKEVGKGTGLGLSVVYGIVKQSGGFIYLDSEPGRGTTFRIFLPRHIPAAEELREKERLSAPAAPESKPAEDDTGQGTILLVEDEDGLRGLNARGLASRGYTVLEASNGVEAAELHAQHEGKIDLVVSDVVMPEMDGPTLLKELRRRDPKVKIIFVSGYAEDAFANLAKDEQFAFLPKPFTLKQLIAKVKETTG